jgi:hypothetical protein
VGHLEIEPSPGQRLLWHLDRYRGGDGAMNCPLLCRVRGHLDLAHLRTALGAAVARHESLRTVFAGRGRTLVQRVLDPEPVDPVLRDVSGGPDPESAMHEQLAAELRTRVDPSQCPIRVTLWRVSGDDHVLCVNMHHLVTDSWSLGVVFEDICAVLDREAGGSGGLPPLGWQFRQFAAAQQAELGGAPGRRLTDWWRDRLDGMRLPAVPLSPAPADRTERTTALVRGDVGPEVVAGLRDLARSERTTLFSVLLTVYFLVLHRVTGDVDLAVASLFANRSRPETRRTVGFLANMLVLRQVLDPRRSVASQVRATHSTVVEAFLHQALPYQLLPVTGAERTGRRADDVVFQMLADPVYTTTAGGAEIEVMVPDGVGSRFELELVLVPVGEALRALLFHDAARLEPGFAERFVDRYVTAAAAVARRPDIPLAQV